MKNLTRWTLAGALAALVVMPGRAEAQTLYQGEACGGTSFEFCADVTLNLNTDGTNYWYTLTVINLDYTSTCAGGVPCVVDGDVFTRIGLINLPATVQMERNGRFRDVNVEGDYFIAAGTADTQIWAFNTNQGLSGNNAYGAGERIAYTTVNGINGGIVDTGSMTFRFDVVAGSMTMDQMLAVGWGIHAQGYGLEDCSSKLGGTSAGVIDSELEDDGLNCVPVPEPGTNALLAIGMVGLAFVAVRRRSLSELLG